MPNLTNDMRKDIRAELGDIYATSKQNLCASMGEHCAYCEIPGAGRDFDIEHKLPKSLFVMDMINWNNFLISCKVCNSSAKRDADPSRIYGIERATYGTGAVLIAVTDNARDANLPAPLNYNAVRDAARDFCLWPDVGGRSFQVFEYALYVVGLGAPLPPATSTHFQTIETASNNNQITATLFDPVTNITTPGQNVQVRIAVRPANGAANQAHVEFGRDKTLAMLRLNDVIPPQPGHSFDERIYKRTRAWFLAVRKFRRLVDTLSVFRRWYIQALAINTIVQFYNFLVQRVPGNLPQLQPQNITELAIQQLVTELANQEWDDLCDQVESTGFYSVWLAVARAYNQQLAQQLANRLNARATAVGAAVATFKGVNLADVLPYL
jgi:hypothetical protein